MTDSWFVEPAIDRLPLSDGHFIDVKRELNAGERRRVFADMVRDGVTPNEVTKLDPFQVGLTKVMQYLVGWSLMDSSGQPVPISEAAVLNLKGFRFNELSDAIDAHEQRQEEARAEARKKTLDGESGLKVISGSRA